MILFWCNSRWPENAPLDDSALYLRAEHARLWIYVVKIHVEGCALPAHLGFTA